QRVGDSNLYLCPIVGPGIDPRKDVTASAVLELWGYLKSRVDLVVVDSAPASNSADGVSLARTADGVVLVLEAEGTRRPVAANLLDAVRKAGGNVLGVVFNKRRYYIPDSIYRKL
ncbi:MAG: chromosome partitioning protein, partial [Deltaproteobacteria bacterium]|nr:chromosome partitioning protein [Deltaproteobacteria bacterium]